jgi:hypothetical protein
MVLLVMSDDRMVGIERQGAHSITARGRYTVRHVVSINDAQGGYSSSSFKNE